MPITTAPSRLQAGIKDQAGKAFSFAIIGEAGENAFPAGADSQNEYGKPVMRNELSGYAPTE
mgnify:CR=1 FL=1